MKKIIIGFVLLLMISLLFGQSRSEYKAQFEEANDLYQSGNYDEALSKYLNITEDGYESKEIYINIGNTYYKKHDIAKAILFYERCLKIAPGSKDARENLSLAKEKMAEEVIAVEPFFLYKWWTGLRDTISADMWTILSILFLLTMIAGLYFWILDKGVRKKKLGFRVMLLSCVLCLFSFLMAYSSYGSRLSQDFAIVMIDHTAMKSGADERSDDVKDLRAGMKVRILDKIGSWYKVVTMDKEQGWIYDNTVTVI